MPKLELIRELPSVDYLQECFVYDPDTGVLMWKERPRKHFATTNIWAVSNAKHAGKIAGNISNKGYRNITIGLREYKVHRVIWKLMTNEEPPPMLDHINGIRADNRWCNLRVADWWEQAHNRKMPVNNTSGRRGVYQKGARWGARIGIDGAMRSLGGFATAEEASRAYENAARELHGKFYRQPQER
jgi:hypothetical protein